MRNAFQTLQEIYIFYCQLPSPRVRYIMTDPETLRKFIAHFPFCTQIGKLPIKKNDMKSRREAKGIPKRDGNYRSSVKIQLSETTWVRVRQEGFPKHTHHWLSSDELKQKLNIWKNIWEQGMVQIHRNVSS